MRRIFTFILYFKICTCKCQVPDNKSTYLLWSQKQLICYMRLGIVRKLRFLFDRAVSQLVSSVYICKRFDILILALCTREVLLVMFRDNEPCSFFWVMRRAWLYVPFWIALLAVHLTPLTSHPTSRCKKILNKQLKQTLSKAASDLGVRCRWVQVG